MPATQLTKGNTQIAVVTATPAPPANAGQNYIATINPVRGVALAGATTQFVPQNEYWYLTGVFLNPNQSPTALHGLLLTLVNFIPQMATFQEDEVQQGTYNKLTLPSTEWIQLPSGISWQQAIQPTVTYTTTTTTVTFQETILRVPLALLK